ncbi:MAG: LysR substrate-binding domain-containing protein [Sulfitobacter sp.]
MRYSQLRAFHYVALYGGFSHAAGVLNQTQPALSDQVKRLEQTHDTLLFHRDRRQIHLTKAGEGLFRLTKQFFEIEQGIGEYLGKSQSAITGTLRIIADSALHITDAISHFRQHHPKVFLSIQTGNTQEVLTRLRNYDAEVGVVGNHPAAKELDAFNLGQTPIIAITAKGFLPENQDALAFSDLPNWPLVFREVGSRTRANLEEVAQGQKLRLKPVIEVDGREAMREVVASGAGIGFVSEAEYGHDDRLQRLKITGINLKMVETLIHLKMRRDVPVIRAFMRSVHQVTANPASGVIDATSD